ncbi:MAG TPA: dimethylamine monooxygenase subunit DmmA family protein [Bacillales bacterium]|nr:dimethylamine monooxygenase subunit DmmA family protein [Bacillales bacterium]
MNFEFAANKRLYLLFGDEAGRKMLQEIEKTLAEKELPFERHYGRSDAAQWLSQQKMGSYLYGAGRSDWVDQMKRLAENAGFSEEEMQWLTVGAENKQVFCSGCHAVQRAGSRRRLACANCGLPLSVSEHYSTFHRAYLGYPDE